MEKRFTIFTIVSSVLFATILVGIGMVIGRSLYEPKTVVLNTNPENDELTTFTETENTISVVGRTKLNIKPEIAIISLGIEICDPDAQSANSRVNDELASVTAGLQELGLTDTEIVASNFSLYPRYDNNYSLLSSFCATNRIRVTTTKLDLVSIILDKAIASGATNIYGVSFTAQDIEAASQEGIQLAFQDAEQQAQILATLMNVSVQEVVSSEIEISGYLLDTLVGYSGGGGGVDPQDGALTIQVTIVYRLSK